MTANELIKNVLDNGGIWIPTPTEEKLARMLKVAIEHRDEWISICAQDDTKYRDSSIKEDNTELDRIAGEL